MMSFFLDAVDVASAFRSLEKRKKALGVDEYMFNQPSLEQVFLKFAASARDACTGSAC